MSEKFRKYFTILGAVLCYLPLDFGTTWGNLSVYTFSYLFQERNITSGLDMPWVITAYIIGWNIACYVTDSLDKIDPRLSPVIGILLFNSAYCFSYFFVTMTDSVTIFLATGTFVGIGTGFIYCSIYKSVSTCANSDNLGSMVFLVFGAQAFGNCVFNPLITWFVNPENVSPSVQVGKLLLFNESHLIARVPYTFLVYAATTFSCQTIGFLMLRWNAPPVNDDKVAPKNHQTYGTTTTTTTNSEKNDSTVVTTTILNDTPSIGGHADNSRVIPSTMHVVDNPNTPASKSKTKRDKDSKESTTSSTLTWCEKTALLWNVFGTPPFYCMWLSYATMEYAFYFVANYYKQFGQIWIKDDHFLTNIAVCMGICAAVSRVLWGKVTDILRIKTCFVIIMAVLTIIPTPIYFMPMLDKWLYLITMTTFHSFRSFLVPSCMVFIEAYFGKERFSTYFGLVTTGGIVANLTAPPIFSILTRRFGWFYCFLFMGVSNLAPLMLVVLRLPLQTGKYTKTETITTGNGNAQLE